MDNKEYDLLRRKRIENVVTVIVTMYALGVAVAASNSAPRWILYIMEAAFIAIWMLRLTGFRSYGFRAFVTTLLSESCVCLYCIFVNDDLGVMVSVIGLIIIIGLYEIQRLLIIPLISTTIIIIHHIFISRTISLADSATAAKSLMEILAVYITIAVVIFLIREEEKSKIRLLDTIDELKMAQRSKDDFLANVSHELRTPINTICGMSEIAISEAKSEVTRENLEDIRTAGKNLLSVVSDILDFSELSSGKLMLNEEPYNISSTINDVVNMSIGKIGSKKIEFIVNCDPTLPSSLIGDESKLKRVMVNLIDNAVKYTTEGYVIIDISKRYEEYGINLNVRVKDTGIGIRPEGLGRIFADFTQLSTGRDRKAGGMGLGLTISRTMVELMGGFLSVESQYGKGTEVQFTIPQRVESDIPIGALDARLYSVNIETVETDEYGKDAVRVTGRVERETDHEQIIMPNAHVLIVDDSFMNIKVLEGLLKPYRIKVTTAASGREALEKIVSRDYDFVFMDHMMPEMDGVECVRRIREKENGYYKTVPIIALTANAVTGAKEMFLEQGFNDFITKPIDISGLERMLKKYVPKDKISYTEADAEDEKKTAEAIDGLIIGDLDVKKGLLYCGTLENYRNVLMVHATNGPDNIEKIRQLYEENDIENYTIYIHALKSSMASIGADKLSGMARDMEQAGKDNNTEYIKEHHEELMAEYERVVAMLLGQNAVQMEVTDEYMETDNDPIDDEKFENYLNRFENAAYTFVPDNMYKILDELKNYSYNGHPLSPQLVIIRRKVEMSDYMSAVDALSSIRERYRNR